MNALLRQDMLTADLAKRLKASKQSVLRQRVKLGLPLPPSARKLFWTQDKLRLLGTMPDQRLAQKLAVKSYTVKYLRRKLRIPGQNDGGRSHR